MEQAESPQALIQAFLDAADRLGNFVRYATVGKAIEDLLDLTQTLMLSVDPPTDGEDEAVRVMAIFKDGRRRPVLRKTLLEAVRELSGTAPVKYCSKCKIALPLDKFTTASDEPDGRHHACKSCERTRQAEHYRRKKAKRDEPAAPVPPKPPRS